MWDNPIIQLDKHPVDRSGRDIADKLFRIAELQHGLFKAKQAKAAGYSEQAQHHNAKVGHWIREHRGIYRLVRYRLSERKQRQQVHCRANPPAKSEWIPVWL
jgi:hypothetical protein